MNDYKSSRESLIEKLYSTGNNLKARSNKYHTGTGEGLEFLVAYLERNPAVDPYSSGFSKILKDLPIPVKSRWIAKKMIDDPHMTAAEATTKLIQVKGYLRKKRT